ncbi:MAG: PIN domain-containing protein, partial [Comamonadaceae bacterium]|nr:PIN domain-containing protein [Comamonadaceae bacterium]
MADRRPRAPARVQEPPARYLQPGQMVLLLDTCVVLDLLLLRQPFAPQACALFEQAEQGQLQAVLCATTLTTIDYLACKQVGRSRSRAMLQDL